MSSSGASPQNEEKTVTRYEIPEWFRRKAVRSRREFLPGWRWRERYAVLMAVLYMVFGIAGATEPDAFMKWFGMFGAVCCVALALWARHEFRRISAQIEAIERGEDIWSETLSE